VDSTIEFLNQAGYGSVMFSVMDVNKDVVKQIAQGYDGQVIAGGYIDKEFFADTPNVIFKKSIQGAAKALKVDYKRGQSFKHFKDTKTVPRMCMSKGCLHQCVFCTVPKGMETIPDSQIQSQIQGFKNLDYKLVYLDDKTFGQSKNYKDLTKLKERIQRDNPDFQGFIVQTSATQLNKLDDQFLQNSRSSS